MSNRDWLRSSKSNPCPICDHTDWCLVSADGSSALCMRVESDRPSRSGGWDHRLRESDRSRRDGWKVVRRIESVSVSSTDWLELAKRLHRSCSSKGYAWLSNRLGISERSLRSLRVGWNGENRSFSFPMREPNGNVCGIRYRSMTDAKFSERGGREGLFFCPTDLVPAYLLVVEGASDTAAMIDVGYPSVIGRDNCTGNISQIVTLCRRLKPASVVVIPDNDVPGIDGANRLIEALPCGANLLLLPDAIKDVRECIQSKENAEWLAGQIGIITNTKTFTNGSTKHVNNQ